MYSTGVFIASIDRRGVEALMFSPSFSVSLYTVHPLCFFFFLLLPSHRFCLVLSPFPISRTLFVCLFFSISQGMCGLFHSAILDSCQRRRGRGNMRQRRQRRATYQSNQTFTCSILKQSMLRQR